MALHITDYEKDKPKLNKELRELEQWKNRVKMLEDQVRRLVKQMAALP